jgi:hypothetical protein
MKALAHALTVALFLSAPAFAQTPETATPNAPDPYALPEIGADGNPLPAAAETESVDESQDESDSGDTGYRNPEPESAFSINGFVDLGYVDAQGDGTSFAPGDTRVPADYGVDTFAPAVNSFGDAASTQTDNFTNGFLPNSAGVGGRPSFLINGFSTDLRYTSASKKLVVFSRVQLLPRHGDGGQETRLWLRQAFARVIPFDAHEMALFIGKFDSVYGIEYLDNPSNIRTGVTQSLFARYTTGESIGAKLFYRFQVAPLWSALSFNASATNSGSMSEALMPAEVSLTGRPVFAGRLGYELNLPRVQLKLGASAVRGPRNDQHDPGVKQRIQGVDARLYFAGISLSGEYSRVEQDEGSRAEKFTGAGEQFFASSFWAQGGWVQLSYRLPFSRGFVTGITPYVRGEQRRAEFGGFTPIKVRRITAGLRLDLGDGAALKGEWLKNDEIAGAPTVKNDVVTVSLVLVY